jgi:phosphomannomutase
VGPVRDSLVGVALVLQLMAETEMTVSQLAAEIGSYYMTKEKFPADRDDARQMLESAKTAFPHARLDTTDGCRFDFEDGWLHLRTSNTEPVMRAIVEAKHRRAAEEYLGVITRIRTEVLG